MQAKEQADEEYVKRKVTGKAAKKVCRNLYYDAPTQEAPDNTKPVESDPESVDSMMMDVVPEESDFDEPAPKKKAPAKKKAAAAKANTKAPTKGKGKKVVVSSYD